MRPLDNGLITAYVERTRQAGGLSLVYKKGAGEAAERLLRSGGTLCFIADQDAGRKGIFVDFFGVPACTTTGIARVALHTAAAVVPGYAVWDESLQKYRLRFEAPLNLVRTGDLERDVLENTQRFAKVIEEIIRKYPDQWVWVHARWKTRPAGEPPLYDFL